MWNCVHAKKECGETTRREWVVLSGIQVQWKIYTENTHKHIQRPQRNATHTVEIQYEMGLYTNNKNNTTVKKHVLRSECRTFVAAQRYFTLDSVITHSKAYDMK